jgi:predicted Fe-S protein YdhL (DUF1289 family)
MKKSGKKGIVTSPCVKKCSLDNERVCPECLRTIDEIISWPDADDETRKKILQAAKLRRGRLNK